MLTRFILPKNFLKKSEFFILLYFIAGFFANLQSATIEEKIRSGKMSTSDLIVSYHPRLWFRGTKDWDRNLVGSFAWRIHHGLALKKNDPTNDSEKYEFYYSICGIDYGADYMHKKDRPTYRERILEPIIAGKAKQLGWENCLPVSLPSYSKLTFTPQFSADEYFADARDKLLWVINQEKSTNAMYTILYGSVSYDWLINEKYTNGNPVFSAEDKKLIHKTLIENADFLKAQAKGAGHFFKADEIAAYMYPMVGMALYERAREGEAEYAAINKKAKEYLDDFDKYWVGKILPTLNEQGGDGGWHGGLTRMFAPWRIKLYDTEEYNIPEIIAPLLFSHFTATDLPIEESLFSTGVIKHFVEFQNYMIRPSGGGYKEGAYYAIGGDKGAQDRAPWVFPMRTFSRRRFSSHQDQLKLAELGAWINSTYQLRYTDSGSWDTLDQLLFEDKWVKPRNPIELGYGTKHFKKLGWVFMRTGFGKTNDLAALFICQRYHWSHLDPYAQNSFTLEYQGDLIKGFNNTILIDNQGQRRLENFPTVAQGIEAYAPGSAYDVGPGILEFETNRIYDYVFGDATNAYDQRKLEKFTRQIVYLKPDKFVIFDRVVTTDRKYKKNWQIHPGATPQVINSDLLVIKNGSAALWMKKLLPEVVVIENQTSENYQIAPYQSNQEDFFLFVLQTTNSAAIENAPKTVVAEAKLIIKDNKIGVQINRWEILFSKFYDSRLWIRQQ